MVARTDGAEYVRSIGWPHGYGGATQARAKRRGAG